MIELLFLLMVKHCICDLGLQSQLLWGKTINKQYYFGCHSHYLHHLIGTFLVILLFFNPLFALTIAVIDYIAHWHIDYTKHRVQLYWKLGRADKWFWWITCVDQLLHFLTYYFIVLYIAQYHAV